VVAKLPVPLPLTSPVKVIVWSPVFAPDELPEKLEAEKVLVTPKVPAIVVLPLAESTVNLVVL
jgi:hypothetical protein